MGFKVVWHGLNNESVAKSISQSIMEFRVEKTCKALLSLGIQNDVVLSLIKNQIDTFSNSLSKK